MHDDESGPMECDDDDEVLKIVSVQNFDGSFQLAPVLAILLKSTVEELKTSIAFLVFKSISFSTELFFFLRRANIVN